MSSSPKQLAAVELNAQPLLQGSSCSTLINRHVALDWANGTVGKNNEGPNSTDFEIRRCHVTSFLSADVLNRIELIGQNLFDVDASADCRLGFHSLDPPSILRYRQGDFFDWHVDTGRGGVASGRSVSFSVQLSDPLDYTGGDLEFITRLDNTQRNYLRRRGHIVFFPSHVAHRVTEVSAGVRYAIVGWLHFQNYVDGHADNELTYI